MNNKSHYVDFEKFTKIHGLTKVILTFLKTSSFFFLYYKLKY